MSPQLDLNANVTNLTLSMIQTTNNMLKARVVSFVKEITDSLPPGAANAIKDTLLGHCSISGFSSMVNDLRKSPMRLHFSARKKRLFVTHVLGDLFASAVSALRREVTAIVRNAESGDEVLVVLQSAGGTVTGYGLLTAQLLRIKDAGLKLTIAVEQVAASGGYMAASVGDVIFCSPFAVVGSIGVLQEMPNFYERLKREGVQFHQITAGDFKRVLSLTKEATPEDLKKAKEDVEDVWKLFKDFVAEQRPSLKMDLVATGEVWFGKRALEVGLCDAIQVSDDVLTDFMDRGYDVYRVKYEEPVEKLFEKFWNLDKVSAGKGNTLGLLLHWFLQKVVSLLQVDVGTDSTYKETLESWNTILLV
jgi:signal peptide peptidase SppA